MKTTSQMISFLLVLGFARLIWANPLNFTNQKPRIIDGQNAQRNQFPYVVAIEYSGVYFCGGTILTSQWIISSAFYFSLVKDFQFTVIAGLLNRKEEHPNNQIIKAAETVIHPDYENPKTPNDIALLRLESSLIFNEAVKPIPLLCDQEPTNAELVTAGWGLITLPAGFATTLQYMTLSLTTPQECRRILDEHQLTEVEVTDQMLCGLPSREAQSSCIADFGNPLVQSGKLIGIKNGNYLEDCGISSDWTKPNLFTKIREYADFIKETVGWDVCDFDLITTTTPAITTSTEEPAGTTPSSGFQQSSNLLVVLITATGLNFWRVLRC